MLALGDTMTVELNDGSSTGVHGVNVVHPVHHLRRLTLGDMAFDDLLVTARDDGVLGRDVLNKLPWLLHGPRRELWLLQKP